ncbi:hypothetical protein DOY81_002479, partial [Sarcophaga bullata]
SSAKMFQHLKFYVTLSLLMGLLLTSWADTKVLSSLDSFNNNHFRHETVHLDDDQHLVIEGSYGVDFEVASDLFYILKVTVTYVADKNGNRVKYVFVQTQRPQMLNPATLKSSAG